MLTLTVFVLEDPGSRGPWCRPGSLGEGEGAQPGLVDPKHIARPCQGAELTQLCRGAWRRGRSCCRGPGRLQRRTQLLLRPRRQRGGGCCRGQEGSGGRGCCRGQEGSGGRGCCWEAKKAAEDAAAAEAKKAAEDAAAAEPRSQRRMAAAEAKKAAEDAAAAEAKRQRRTRLPRS